MNAFAYAQPTPTSPVTAGDHRRDPPDDPQAKVNEAADDLYAVESKDLWALASQLEWLWYSPRETAHDPDAVKALQLMADGSDDAELGRIIRERTQKAVKADCSQRAEDAANGVLS